MQRILIIMWITFLFLFILAASPPNLEAQYSGLGILWGFQPMPLFPYLSLWGIEPFLTNPFPIYTRGYFGLSFPPAPSSLPFLVEPSFRIANTPVTLSIPPLTTTAAPLTVILNLIDPAVLAANIAVLTTNYPLVYDLLVTTFSLPI